MFNLNFTCLFHTVKVGSLWVSVCRPAYRQVVSEQLHDKSAVFVAVVLQSLKVFDCLVKSLQYKDGRDRGC